MEMAVLNGNQLRLDTTIGYDFQFSKIRSASILLFAPPPIPGRIDTIGFNPVGGRKDLQRKRKQSHRFSLPVRMSVNTNILRERS